MKSIILILSLLFSITAFAGDIQWNGTYRFEGNYLMGSDLKATKEKKAFGTNHLVLKPKIILGDGLEVLSRFDLFNSYNNSQIGGIWGLESADNRSFQQAQGAGDLQITQLYLSFVQEYGAWIVGRAPLEFGLGMTYSSGEGLWDHWYSTRDLFGYKMIMGNLTLFPMLAKVSEGALSVDGDMTDFIIQLQYDLPESNVELGFMYLDRSGSYDTSTRGIADYYSITHTMGDMSYKNMNFYVAKKTKTMRFALEAANFDGDLGVYDVNNDKVSLSSMALAFEWDWRPEASNFAWGTRLGYASGDDASTADQFEGYFFNRNYDVAFLLFNYNVGKVDVLGNRVLGGYQGTNNNSFNSAAGYHDAKVSGEADTAALSNVIYLSPYMEYQWSDQWMSGAQLTAAFLNETDVFDDVPAAITVDSDLGFELDLSLTYKPNSRLEWVNEVGVFMPGSALKGASGLDNDMMYGLRSKVGVRF